MDACTRFTETLAVVRRLRRFGTGADVVGHAALQLTGQPPETLAERFESCGRPLKFDASLRYVLRQPMQFCVLPLSLRSRLEPAAFVERFHAVRDGLTQREVFAPRHALPLVVASAALVADTRHRAQRHQLDRVAATVHRMRWQRRMPWDMYDLVDALLLAAYGDVDENHAQLVELTEALARSGLRGRRTRLSTALGLMHVPAPTEAHLARWSELRAAARAERFLHRTAQAPDLALLAPLAAPADDLLAAAHSAHAALRAARPRPLALYARGYAVGLLRQAHADAGTLPAALPRPSLHTPTILRALRAQAKALSRAMLLMPVGIGGA